MRKLKEVLGELKSFREQRNLLAESIETMQNPHLVVQLSLGTMYSDSFKIEVPEFYLDKHDYSQRDLLKNVKEHVLVASKKELLEVIEYIAKLEIEEVNILHTLATPLIESENE